MDDQQLNYTIGDKLSEAIGHEGEMITKWLAIIEVMDTDGQRALRLLTNSTAKTWDNLGLLTYALQYEQAVAVRDDD